MSKNKVYHYTTKDKNMMKAIARTGCVSREQLKDNFKLGDKRINNYKSDGYIKEISYYNKTSKNFEKALKLTEKGKEMCVRECGIRNFYSSSSPNHDMQVSRTYFSLDEQTRETWITEQDWRDAMSEHIEELNLVDENKANQLQELWDSRKISPPDCGYVSAETGTVVAIEVATVSYDKQHIEAKEKFTQELDVDLKVDRIDGRNG